MKKTHWLPTETLTPLLSLVVFVLFTVLVHMPASKEEQPFNPELLPGDPARHHIVSVIEPSAMGAERFLCRSMDTEGKAFWFTMSHDDYYGTFQELFSVKEGVFYNNQFVYEAKGIVCLHGYAVAADRSLQRITGPLLLEVESMELLP